MPASALSSKGQSKPRKIEAPKKADGKQEKVKKEKVGKEIKKEKKEMKKESPQKVVVQDAKAGSKKQKRVEDVCHC
jgi:hypothetical protein